MAVCMILSLLKLVPNSIKYSTFFMLGLRRVCAAQSPDGIFIRIMRQNDQILNAFSSCNGLDIGFLHLLIKSPKGTKLILTSNIEGQMTNRALFIPCRHPLKMLIEARMMWPIFSSDGSRIFGCSCNSSLQTNWRINGKKSPNKGSEKNFELV